MTSRIWITWENHRRSRVLAHEFECKYVPITFNTSRFFRYPALSLLTILLIIRENPKILFCQNPSIVLSALCAILKPVFKYKLIVDRHSNFKTETKNSKLLKWRLFHILSDFSLKKSDITIVTNDYLKCFVNNQGGKAFVLPDKIPEFGAPESEPYFFKKMTKNKVVCITTFDDDEPIEELIESAFYMKEKATLFLTGNYGKVLSQKQKYEIEGKGVYLCGFIDEETYLATLAYADAIVVLTKKDHILNCGAYEALAAEKPLILSKTSALQEYFGTSPIYVNPRCPREISEAIGVALTEKETVQSEILCSKEKLTEEWSLKFLDIVAFINNL